MKLLSWNLASRLRHIPQQVEMLASRAPDLVALQEVTRPGLSRLRTLLAHGGLMYQADSFELAPCPTLFTGPRRYGLLIASRFPLRPWEPNRFNVPWPERLLSVGIDTPYGLLELHTTHIPPGGTNGWIKIEMLEGLYAGLAHPSIVPRVLCGDFNTPQLERPTGEIVTRGRRSNAKDVAVIRQHLRGGEGVRRDRVSARFYRDLPLMICMTCIASCTAMPRWGLAGIPTARTPIGRPVSSDADSIMCLPRHRSTRCHAGIYRHAGKRG